MLEGRYPDSTAYSRMGHAQGGVESLPELDHVSMAGEPITRSPTAKIRRFMKKQKERWSGHKLSAKEIKDIKRDSRAEIIADIVLMISVIVVGSIIVAIILNMVK